MGRQKSLSVTVLAGSMLVWTNVALAQFTQQGPKLVGTGGGFAQGTAVALSGDGNTAIVGGPGDTSGGAAWIFTRKGGLWTQQGRKLVGGGRAAGDGRLGASVALSGDGNTAIAGSPNYNSGVGAAWIFTRKRGFWTPKGQYLAGAGGHSASSSNQGASVALSGDGNTAIVGGPYDNSNAGGAAWIFTRKGAAWTQQGPKLVGTGEDGFAAQGISVALSADGNTALVGGPMDNGGAGAAWIFTRSGGVWSQEGPRLVATDAVGDAKQGTAVALSADGNTAVVGGSVDNDFAGAAWVFTRSGGVWGQQGPKLVGTGGRFESFQGSSVALSGDGNTALLGGPGDSVLAGAAWAFTRSGGVWTQLGSKLVVTGGGSALGDSVSLSTDGNTAIVGGPLNNSNVGAAWVFVKQTSCDGHDPLCSTSMPEN